MQLISIKKKKTIFIPVDLRYLIETYNKRNVLWTRGNYGTWFKCFPHWVDVSTNRNTIELSFKALKNYPTFIKKSTPQEKKNENSFFLKKTSTICQNIILGTSIGFKKKLRLRYAPDPTFWLCADRHPIFEVKGTKLEKKLPEPSEQKNESPHVKNYLTAVFVHTKVHYKKKRSEKVKQKLLWDFKTQRYAIRKKEKLTRETFKQPRVQIKSKSLVSLGVFVAQMRNKKRPNYYNGKGIRYYKDVIPTILIKKEKKETIKKRRKGEKPTRSSRTMGKKPNLWA